MVDKSHDDGVESGTTSERERNNDSYIPSKPDSTQPVTTKKTAQPTKLVDLGAAAVFASQAAAAGHSKETATSTIDSVFGDFSGGQGSSQPPATTAQQGRYNIQLILGVAIM